MAKASIKDTLTGIIDRISKTYTYCVSGIWEDSRPKMSVRILKTINLSVQSFLNRDLQIKSMSITYQTILALVPALALLLAISRGFGFQDTVVKELFNYFPAQSKALSTGLTFVDSYLKEASSGIFVGVGIIVLLWTLISLLSNIEDAFNNIWDLKSGRTFIEKVKDYIAIFLLIPILMIMSSGISIFMSATITDKLHLAFLTPMVNGMLETLPFVLSWAAFALCFWLIPNTKVKFGYAAISAILCAIAFEVMQLLFLNGQIYVSKYNAIYGSFAFLPLLLIWLQLSWLLLLTGCGITYSLQNVFSYNFFGDMTSVAEDYRLKVLLVITAVIYRRFHNSLPAPTREDLSQVYGLPIRMVSSICEMLLMAGLIQKSTSGDTRDNPGYVPTTDTDLVSIKDVVRTVAETGRKDFIPEFKTTYAEALSQLDAISSRMYEATGDTLIRDLDIFISIDRPEHNDTSGGSI